MTKKTTKKNFIKNDWTKFPIIKQDVIRSFDDWTYSKGDSYYSSQLVQSMKVVNSHVEGIVEGSFEPYYQVSITRNGNTISGSCSCPVGGDCKHCVALALQWAALKKDSNKIKNNIQFAVKKDKSTYDDQDNGDEDYDDEDNYDDEDADDENYDDDDEENNDDEDEEINDDEKEDEYEDDEADKANRPKFLPIQIPTELNFPNVHNYFNSFQHTTKSDLEQLLNFIMPSITQNPEITIFSPDYITQAWEFVFEQTDNEFPIKLDPKDSIILSKKEREHVDNDEGSLSSNSSETSIFRNEDGRIIHYTPLQILSQFKNEDSLKIMLQIWFTGYVELVDSISQELDNHGMLDEDGLELYEYYKNEEYQKLEKDQEDNREKNNYYDRSSYSRGYYDDYDEELEPYEDFDLDSDTLQTYLNWFFQWISEPIKELCDYINLLNQYQYNEHTTFLLKKGIQWILDLSLPISYLGLDNAKLLALNNLKTIIISKLSQLSNNFATPQEFLAFLFQLFQQNPSVSVGEHIWNQIQNKPNLEENVDFLVDKLWNEYTKYPSWEKNQLLYRLILKYIPNKIQPFIELLIQKLHGMETEDLVQNQLFELLTSQPLTFISKIESSLIKLAQKGSKSQDNEKKDFYIRCIEWFVSTYNNANNFEQSFEVMREFIRQSPKLFTISHFLVLDKIIQNLPSKTNEFQLLVTTLLTRGTNDLKFKLHLNLKNYDSACQIIPLFSNESSYYSEIKNIQWTAIMDILPYLTLISQDNKEMLLKLLQSQLDSWFNSKHTHRPDASIAEIISQIQQVYYSFQKKDGKKLWDTWFTAFSNKHYRLTNLQAALSRRGLKMKKT